jgi:hypothetical protein
MERNPNKNHCKTNVIYLLIHVAQASTSSTFGFQKFFFSIYQYFSSIHHPHHQHHHHQHHQHHQFIAFPTPQSGQILNVHPCAIHHLLLHLSICYIHHQLSSSYSQQKWSNSESTSMWNPSSSFASVYILHPLILIIIFTAFIDTQKWPNSESVSIRNPSSSFASIYFSHSSSSSSYS